MSREIECTIDTDGKAELEGLGFKGKSCVDIIDEIAKAMGTKVKTTIKQDFYQPEDIKIKQKLSRF